MKQTKHSTIILAWGGLCLWLAGGTQTAYSQNIRGVTVLEQVNVSRMGVASANYSGITHIKDGRYAVVDDKSIDSGVSFWDIRMNAADGRITGITQSFMHSGDTPAVSSRRDTEGVAYCPATSTLFVAAEDDQEVLEYDMKGMPTGRKFDIPQLMGKSRIYGNLGFESLTYNDRTKLFWTTTEASLKSDGVPASAHRPCERNMLRLQSFGLDLKPKGQYAYRMEAPRMMKKKGLKTFVHGVSDIVALDDGRLIVMERELCVTRKYLGSYCSIRLFLVSPAEHAKIEDATDVKTLPDDRLLKKSLLCEFTTHLKLGKMDFANYEGLCLGPKLSDGRQTLILVNDSQHGAGNMFKRLKEYLKVIVLKM